MQEKRLNRVLLVYRAMIPSIRLCGHCQMELLARRGKIEYRAVQENKLKNRDLNWADVVILGRLDSWYEYKLTKKLYEAGTYLAYILDDDLLNIPSEISSASYYGRKEIRRNICAMVEMSRAIISPSPLLLQKYAIKGKKAIRIEEPAIEPIPYRAHDPNQPVKIGFAGSVDRAGDIEKILKQALIRVKQDYGERVRFEFFGAIPSFANDIDATCIPYCDSYDAYRRTLNSLEWDIGLAPMPDTLFHACKHYNKFIEYAAVGVVGIFSDLMPYKRLKSINAPARFCNNDSDAWYTTICELLNHQEEREELRKRCAEIAMTRFDVVNTVQSIERMLNEVEPDEHKSDIKGVSGLRLRGMCRRIAEKWDEYGLKLPLVLARKSMKMREFGGKKV